MRCILFFKADLCGKDAPVCDSGFPSALLFFADSCFEWEDVGLGADSSVFPSLYGDLLHMFPYPVQPGGFGAVCTGTVYGLVRSVESACVKRKSV